MATGRSRDQRAGRLTSRPRGKWHLLDSDLRTAVVRTLCGEVMREWDEAERESVNSRDICARCVDAIG